MLICVDCGYSKRITGIPEDDEGLDIVELESQIEIFEREEEGEVERPGWQNWTYRYVFYGVPTFSNPTGSIMSLTRRTQLLEVPSPPTLSPRLACYAQLTIRSRESTICFSLRTMFMIY